jgi:hypothetical protein
MADPLTHPLKAHLEHSAYEIKPSLTFGVEIEFLLATAKEVRLEPEWDDSDKKTYEPDPDPDDSRSIDNLNQTPGKDLAENVRHHIAATMGNAGITTEVGKGTDFKWSPTEKSAWVVNTDQTLKASDEKYDYYQIEIQSPPYYFRFVPSPQNMKQNLTLLQRSSTPNSQIRLRPPLQHLPHSNKPLLRSPRPRRKLQHRLLDLNNPELPRYSLDFRATTRHHPPLSPQHKYNPMSVTPRPLQYRRTCEEITWFG